MELNQKKRFQKRRIIIKESGIKFYFKTPSEEAEHSFSFEELILNKISKKKDVELAFPVVTAVIFLVAILTLIGTITSKDPGYGGYIFFTFFLGLGTLFFFLHRMLGINMRVIIPLTNNRKINILHDVPNEEEVEKFLDTLAAKQSAFLKEKYASVSKRLPVDMQLEQIHWLMDRNIITLAEFSDLRQQLVGKETSGNIGFTNKITENGNTESTGLDNSPKN